MREFHALGYLAVALIGLTGCGSLEHEAPPATPPQFEQSAQPLGPVAVAFDTFSWRYFQADNPGHPRLLGNEVVLLPDDRYYASAVALYSQDLYPPYSIEFEYLTYDNDGGPSAPYNSADGIVLMLGKDRAAYGSQPPPLGGNRGFIYDGTGYGVHLRTYANRGISLQDGTGQELAFASLDTYTGGQWARVRVEVTRSGISVYYNGVLQFTRLLTVSLQYGGVGFGAATGASDSEHRLRNVYINPSVRLPVSSLAGFNIEILSARLNGGGNTLFGLRPGQQLQLSTDYRITQSASCPACIDQVLVGYAPNSPQACIYNGVPSTGGTSGSATINLTAPTTPGLHYLRFDHAADYSCNLGWWQVDGVPTPLKDMALISVNQDPQACSHVTCAQGAALASSCDPCTAQVCGVDPYCCNNWWDSVCVSRVAQLCGASCN